MLMNSNEYIEVLESIKDKIAAVRIKALLSANSELIMLYWDIGTAINERKSWGNKLIDNLARDIKSAYPGATGYSSRNLKYMAKFALQFPSREIVQASLAQLTWYHNIALMDKTDDQDHYMWYAEQTIEHGWSRNVLVHPNYAMEWTGVNP
jgi:predicted nuclease of restriction endonuclease-like (RecB) superfamily